MSEKKEQILETFGKLIPKMSDSEVDKLVAFGEGMAFMKDQQEKKGKAEEEEALCS